MPIRQPQAMPHGRDRTLRHYVDRHPGFVISVSLGFAFASCLGLVMLFGLYAAIGGDNGIVITFGLCSWLLFNAWAIRRFIAHLRRLASDENERLRFNRFKPLQQTS